MTTDWKALCAELADALESWLQAHDLGGIPLQDDADAALINRARTALAQPELQGPKPAPDYGRVPEIATEAQIRSAAQYLVTKQGCDGDLVPAIRYAIARWGRPAIEPKREGPTNEEIDALERKCWKLESLVEYDLCTGFSEVFPKDETFDHRAFARTVLTRWGTPAIEPVPVSERPWERDGWCDAEGMCWWGHLRRFQPENRIVHSWGLAAPGRLDASTVCLPHWALPLPTPTSQEDYD